MIHSIMTCLIFISLVCSSLQSMQQQLCKPVYQLNSLQNDATFVESPYLHTISGWLKNNPAVVAISALGIGSVGGYFLYSKWKKESSLNQLVKKNEPQALVKLQPLKNMYPPASSYALHTKQASTANARFTSLTPYHRPVIQPIQQETEKKYGAEYREQQRITATQLFLENLYEEYKVKPPAEEVIEFYNAGRKVLHDLFSAEQTDEYGYVTVDIARDVASLTANDIRKVVWFLYIYGTKKIQSSIFPQNISFLLHGSDDQITALYNALRLAQPGSSEVSDTTIMALYSMFLGDLPPHNEPSLDYAKIGETLYLKPGNTKTDFVAQVNQLIAQVSHKIHLPEEINSFIDQFNPTVDPIPEFEERYKRTEWYVGLDYINKADQALAEHFGTELIHSNQSNWKLVKDILFRLQGYEHNEALKKIDPRLYQEIVIFTQRLAKLKDEWLERHVLEKINLTIEELLEAPELPKLPKDLTSEKIQREQQTSIY